MNATASKNWSVEFGWPSSGVGHYTFLTMGEARTFARMFGKKITVYINEQRITIH